MGSHAPPPTQPLTCHVNDVLGYGTFRPGSVLARKNMDVSAKMYLICLQNRILLVEESPNKRFTE